MDTQINSDEKELTTAILNNMDKYNMYNVEQQKPNSN